MSSPMKLLEFYRKCWELVGASVTEDGFVRIIGGKDKRYEPVTYDGKPVVIPAPEQLQDIRVERLIFNPLHEDTDKTESPSLASYREHVTRVLNAQAIHMLTSVFGVGFDTTANSDLSAEETDFLRPIGRHPVDPVKFLTKLETLIRKSQARADRGLVSIYIKRAGTIGNKRHRSVAVVSFPLLEELEACERTSSKSPYGVNMSKEERALLVEVLKSIYPYENGKEEDWMDGSDDPFAPKFASLTLAMRRVLAANLNVARIFKGRFTLTNVELYDSNDLMQLMTDTRPLEVERRYYRGIGDCSAPLPKDAIKAVDAALARETAASASVTPAIDAPPFETSVVAPAPAAAVRQEINSGSFMSHVRMSMNAAAQQPVQSNIFGNALQVQQTANADPFSRIANLNVNKQVSNAADMFKAAAKMNVRQGVGFSVIGTGASQGSKFGF